MRKRRGTSSVKNGTSASRPINDSEMSPAVSKRPCGFGEVCAIAVCEQTGEQGSRLLFRHNTESGVRVPVEFWTELHCHQASFSSFPLELVHVLFLSLLQLRTVLGID